MTPAAEQIATMGTIVSVEVRTSAPPPTLQAAVAAVRHRLCAIDEMFSTWKPDSWVVRLGDGRACLEDCPTDVQRLVALSMELMDLTDGYFSPFWRRRTSGAPGPDPTGLVKGWAAQQASDLLLAHGLPDHVVNAAGDLVVSGDPSRAGPERRWRVGISDPHRPRALTGVIEVDATASRWTVATSGVAEHGAHVLDPHTGRPAEALAAATTVTRLREGDEGGAAADAFATALLAAGHGAGRLLGKLSAHGVTGVLLEADGTLHDPDALFLLGL